jgi:DNA-binding LacI/PurR family transcriptional regulator
LSDAGAEVPPLVPADWSAASGYRVGRMLARVPEVTAVFTANDHLALGLLRALHERSLRVPHDVSVVGFDDVPEAGYFIPPLTTVRPDFHAVARHALDLLLAQINGQAPGAGQRNVAPVLVERSSVAGPRA